MENWKALESDPETLSELAHGIGLQNNWGLHELYDLSEDYLNSLPKPILGFLFLYPDSNAERTRPSENEYIFFLEQVPQLGNACGTIGLIHALLNIHLQKNKILTDNKSRGQCLASFSPIQEIHNTIAEINLAPDAVEDEVEFHYIALVNINNSIYELDGCKAGPIKCSPTSESTFPQDCLQYLQEKYFKTDDIRFSLMAIAPIQ